MKTITKLLAVLFILISSLINAQEEQEKSKGLIYIEADPFAYINKGFSIHPGYENWGFRFDLTFVQVDYPENFEEKFYGTKAFDLVTNIFGMKFDYVGKRTNWTRGAFAGLDINYQILHFEHRELNVKKDLYAFNVGIRAGWKIVIWKGLYVTPWAAVWRNVMSTQTFEAGDDMVSTNDWDWLVTLHLGYAFKLK